MFQLSLLLRSTIKSSVKGKNTSVFSSSCICPRLLRTFPLDRLKLPPVC